MSLYNMLFGQNPASGFLVASLNKTTGDFGRFRDAYYEKTDDGGKIIVYTRNGGGNRDDYEDVFDEMETHPLFITDYDDDFDCTYADIFFKYPAGYEEVLSEMAKGTITPAEKWKMLFEQLENK